VENGEDLSEYTMIAFGGAAPLHAARLCEKLGVDACLVPQGAGVGSAIGFLRAPFSFEATRSVFMRMSGFDAGAVQMIFADLQDEATRFVRSCDGDADILTDHKVYMRYAGQGWEIPVALPTDLAATPDPAAILALFEADYTKLFGRIVDGMEVEITVWSVNAHTATPTPARLEPPDRDKPVQATRTRALFDPALGAATSASVVARHDMTPGSVIAGPAIVTEDETTIIVPASRGARVHADGTVVLTRKET
jgi:N-methylhydantoinase A